MTITLNMIQKCLKNNDIKFEVVGDISSVEKVSAIGSSVRDSVCYYVGDEKDLLAGIKRSIIFCKPTLDIDIETGNSYILTDHPQLCFYLVSGLGGKNEKPTINKNSWIDENACIGENVSIGPFCTIEKCSIGDNTVIESGVKIHRNSVIGKNVHIQANSVIGAIGVMWAWSEDGRKIRCYQSGHVIVEDDVFIGSNVSVVRGAFQNLPTVIGCNTMISHGTMIGHGVIIGYSNHFANNVSIGGSVKTGKNCFFGSGASVRPHVSLGDDTTIGAGAVVVKDTIDSGMTLVGCPAKGIQSTKKNQSGVPSPFV